MDPVLLFSKATAQGDEVMAGVSAEQLGLPTPCAEWSVQDLMDHMVGSTEYLLAAIDGRVPAPVVGSTAADYAAGRASVLVGLAAPGALERMCPSPLGFDWTIEQATAGTFMDNLIHTWDLATATGQDGALDPQLVDLCTTMFLPDMPERGRASGLVGPAVLVDADATPQDRLLAANWAPALTDPDIEESIRAFAHSGRRAMLELVWDAERQASDLADHAGLSKSATSQHLKLLRDAGLVHVRIDGNRRLYRADLERVAEVAGFLDEFWATPLERLKATAETRSTNASRRKHA